MWDANDPAQMVTGYRVYMSETSMDYANVYGETSSTQMMINGMVVGHTYYWVVTAYNAEGMESGFSNEVSKTITQANKNEPINIRFAPRSHP